MAPLRLCPTGDGWTTGERRPGGSPSTLASPPRPSPTPTSLGAPPAHPDGDEHHHEDEGHDGGGGVGADHRRRRLRRGQQKRREGVSLSVQPAVVSGSTGENERGAGRLTAEWLRSCRVHEASTAEGPAHFRPGAWRCVAVGSAGRLRRHMDMHRSTSGMWLGCRGCASPAALPSGSGGRSMGARGPPQRGGAGGSSYAEAEAGEEGMAGRLGPRWSVWGVSQ